MATERPHLFLNADNIMSTYEPIRFYFYDPIVPFMRNGNPRLSHACGVTSVAHVRGPHDVNARLKRVNMRRRRSASHARECAKRWGAH
jgi:hypothetical protein